MDLERWDGLRVRKVNRRQKILASLVSKHHKRPRRAYVANADIFSRTRNAMIHGDNEALILKLNSTGGVTYERMSPWSDFESLQENINSVLSRAILGNSLTTGRGP